MLLGKIPNHIQIFKLETTVIPKKYTNLKNNDKKISTLFNSTPRKLCFFRFIIKLL